MNFKRIETFYWVATLGSFRKAAEQQCTTQPAISSRISMLEEELGVLLFKRDGNSKVVLTPKGSELLGYAQKLVYLSQEFSNIANNQVSYSGMFRLGVSETIAHTWLSIFLKELHNQFPHLTLELTVDLTVNLTQQLHDGLIDLAFLVGPTGDPGIFDEHLLTMPLVWVASTKLKIGQQMQEIQSLSQWPIITYAKNTVPYNEISQKMANNYDAPAKVFSSSSLAICRRLVLDMVGISSLPFDIVKEDIEKGDIQMINTNWHPSDLSFTASYVISPGKYKLDPIIDLAKDVIRNN